MTLVVARLRHSDYGRIIFCGYVRIRTTPRIMKVAPASRIEARGVNGNAEQTEAVR
jgi:hypothetical protein